MSMTCLTAFAVASPATLPVRAARSGRCGARPVGAPRWGAAPRLRRPARAAAAGRRWRAAADGNGEASPAADKAAAGEPTPPERPASGGFLRTNGDVIKFGAALLFGAFAFKAGLQAAGIPDIKAGQLTTGLVSVTGLIGWIGTYFYRVGSKQMTYATQLREYEAGVIAKRYAELTPEELDALAEELESEKE
ncbi:hypothetical protein I4F81_011262 [Pyropia yezoensis]|uniref:Uncharacterized protein n=1 Tax=Pyropia yezoensis TaxID=2788 RepID=A0ACC3CFS3_PYRYE|nr:hypothetical protein I4F81_011262 [Neopyropia yezoensis]